MAKDWWLDCRDCGEPHDIYMVRNHLWIQACPDDPFAGQIIDEYVGRQPFFICLKCLSYRLKRSLSTEDFDFTIPCNMHNRQIEMAVK